MIKALRGTIVCLIAILGCATGRPITGVPLEWDPSAATTTDAKANLAPNRFLIMPFQDRRANPAEFGVNIKDEKNPLPVTTKDNVAQWARDRFMQILRDQGFELVESNETVTLHVEIAKFMVTEAGFFNGEVALLVEARDAAGKELWRGSLVGHSKRWGRTYNLTNYYEAITSAFSGAAGSLVNKEDFLSALPH